MMSNLGCMISVGAIGFVLVKKVAREMWVSIVTTCTVGSFIQKKRSLVREP